MPAGGARFCRSVLSVGSDCQVWVYKRKHDAKVKFDELVEEYKCSYPNIRRMDETDVILETRPSGGAREGAVQIRIIRMEGTHECEEDADYPIFKKFGVHFDIEQRPLKRLEEDIESQGFRGGREKCP